MLSEKNFRDIPGREKAFLKLKDNIGTGTNGHKLPWIYLGRTLENYFDQKREVQEQPPRSSSGWDEGRWQETEKFMYGLFSLLKGFYHIFACHSRRWLLMTQKLWESCLPCTLEIIFEIRA